MSNSSGQDITLSMAHAIVTDRYTRSDELHPRCPLSLQVLRHGSKTSTFHYCHIVPKCLEETLRVRLSNNANNIFPSTELIHKNMELYQQVPSLTVKFERQFNDQFDQYTLVFSRELPFFNELRVFIGATDAQPRRVLLATGSRPFFDLHYRAYQEHHQPVVPTISRFDELVSQQLYSQIMLHSPTMKENHKLLKLKKQTSSCFQIAVREDNCNNFPQMGVSRGDAMRLVDTIFQMSSTFFENWQVAERMMPAWIIQHHSRSRTFEIGFRPECDLVVDAEEFKRGFSDDPAHEIWLVSEASLLEYGMPGQVKQIIKMPIMGDLPTAKPISRWHKYRSGKANKPPCRTVSQTTITHHRDEEEITREANSTIECVGATIVVYFSMPTGGKGRWQEGVIITREGDEVRVRYSDGTELRHTLAKIKYKICHPQSHAIQCIRWECTGCGCDNKTDSIPTARSACTECKRSSLGGLDSFREEAVKAAKACYPSSFFRTHGGNPVHGLREEETDAKSKKRYSDKVKGFNKSALTVCQAWNKGTLHMASDVSADGTCRHFHGCSQFLVAGTDGAKGKLNQCFGDHKALMLDKC